MANNKQPKQVKVRASRNRTITLSEEERGQLQSQMLSLQQLQGGASPHNQIVHADMIEALALLPDGVADLIIVDPPYNLTRTFGENCFHQMGDAAYERYLQSWFPQVCRKLKPDGTLYLCGDWKCSSAMQRVLSEHLYVMNRITWQREKGRGSKHNWKNSMEDIWFAVAQPERYYFNVDAVMQKHRVIAPYRKDGVPKDWQEGDDGKYRLTHPSNFWNDITVPFWSMPENTDHPTQKPEKLIAKLILASSRPGDVVLDPFMGSVVAQKLGRQYIGIEQEEEYCLLALKRLQMAQKDDSIQGYRDGVFLERNE
ncbi:MAG: DNA methyltransferase [Bacteroidales bacterium]|nr:DNA methyltransferase [Bacteroidales bacterium]